MGIPNTTKTRTWDLLTPANGNYFDDEFDQLYANDNYLNYASVTKTTDYTILDTDLERQFVIGDTDNDRTFTLPTAADNNGRLITFLSANTYAGGGTNDNSRKLTIDGEGSETVNGKSSIDLFGYGNGVKLFCDGTGWSVLEIIYNPVGPTNTIHIGGGEYQYTADNYLDGLASYGCGTIGTKTITPLPNNTIFIYVNFYAYNPYSSYCGLRVSSKSTDTQQLWFYSSTSGSFSRCTNSTWIPTNGNKFYIQQWDQSCTVGQFLILGYKVKAVV